jgi:hypothetical protein
MDLSYSTVAIARIAMGNNRKHREALLVPLKEPA